VPVVRWPSFPYWTSSPPPNSWLQLCVWHFPRLRDLLELHFSPSHPFPIPMPSICDRCPELCQGCQVFFSVEKPPSNVNIGPMLQLFRAATSHSENVQQIQSIWLPGAATYTHESTEGCCIDEALQDWIQEFALGGRSLPVSVPFPRGHSIITSRSTGWEGLYQAWHFVTRGQRRVSECKIRI